MKHVCRCVWGSLRWLDGNATLLFILTGIGETSFTSLGTSNDTSLGNLQTKKKITKTLINLRGVMGRGRMSTLTKESVKVDLPWSTWAMTDMLRIFRFLSIKARISSTVKLTYEPTTINDWRKEREKNKFYKSRLHNTYSTKQEKSKGTSKATHLFLCVCLTRINFVCFVQNIPRHFVFFFLLWSQAATT